MSKQTKRQKEIAATIEEHLSGRMTGRLRLPRRDRVMVINSLMFHMECGPVLARDHADEFIDFYESEAGL